MVGKITISRWSRTGDDEPDAKTISIKIEDDTSGIRFLEVEMTPAQLGVAITGTGSVKCEYELRRIDKLGKRPEWTNIEFPMPKHDYTNMKAIAKAAAQSHVPDGWECDNRFDSQGSFFQRDGKTWARCIIRRYV